MDDNDPSRTASPPTRGGTVEPDNRSGNRAANRAAITPEQSQTPAKSFREHFELRDPFDEVTYRAKTFAEMTAKAEQMGASRFTALGSDGTRTPIQKIDGSWQRGSPLPALPPRSAEPLTTRDDVPDRFSELFPELSNPSLARSVPKGPATEKSKAVATAKAIAKMDAQAERAAMAARIESALTERYLIKHAPVAMGDVTFGCTEYRFRGDSTRVAFTATNFRLATDTNSPSVARSMVDLAQARDWKGLRVSGAEDFRRLVWLEATVRGVKAIGYEPTLADLDILKREHEARQTNRIELARDGAHRSGGEIDTPSNEKSSGRGGGRKAVIAAIDAVLIAKHVPQAKRQAVLEAAEHHLARQSPTGILPKIKVYDRSAQPQLPSIPRTSDLAHTVNMAPQARAR